MSLTSTVPAGVPSLRHSSMPVCGPPATLVDTNMATPLTSTILRMVCPLSGESPWNSLSSTVPASVPSLTQSCGLPAAVRVRK
jgi:hypothetical protein